LLFTFDAASAQGGVDDPAQVEAGMAVFESNCVSCHVSEGTGSSSGRPLTDIAMQQPDRAVHVTSVTEGKGNMPAWDATLSAEEIDAVVSYVRLGFVSEAAEEDPPAEEEPAEEPPATGSEVELFLIAAGVLLGAGLLFIRSSRPRTLRS
jgi:mono/diheme cytochrome c family protein